MANRRVGSSSDVRSIHEIQFTSNTVGTRSGVSLTIMLTFPLNKTSGEIAASIRSPSSMTGIWKMTESRS